MKFYKVKKILLAAGMLTMLCGLPACGSTADAQRNDTSVVNGKEPELEDAEKKLSDLRDQEAEIFSANEALWEKLFAAMEKETITKELQEDYNYGDFLLEHIEAAKAVFSEEEAAFLKESAEKIRDLEKDILIYEEIYDQLYVEEIAKNQDGSEKKFPEFTGYDLDGNAVDSSLIRDHAVTLLNFWYTDCMPCVEEMDELEELHTELADMDGILVGINTYTLGGDAEMIQESKELLAQRGVSYQNIYFEPDSEASAFASEIMVFPTTYVLDREGNTVGVVIGGLEDAQQMENLHKLIEEALERVD